MSKATWDTGDLDNLFSTLFGGLSEPKAHKSSTESSKKDNKLTVRLSKKDREFIRMELFTMHQNACADIKAEINRAKDEIIKSVELMFEDFL